MTGTDTATVLRRTQGPMPRRAALQAVWDGIEHEGWIDPGANPIVVRIGQVWRDPLVVETARFLAEAISKRHPALEVHLVDDHTERPTTGESVGVAAIAALDVTIPAEWLEPFFLVTVTGVGPDVLGRLAGPLGAQAEALERFGSIATRDALVYEAHRLGGSDLVVVCGSGVRGDAASQAWWVASPSDVAAEITVARACGLAPDQLPFLRTVAAHETLPTVEESGAPLPPLRGHAAAPLPATLRLAMARTASSTRLFARDLRAIRRNLGKIPHFVRRRLAAVRRKAA